MKSAAGSRWRPSWILGLVLFAATVLRALMAASIELSPDEAYYWAWSTDPQLGYFDHPPLVAWLIGLSAKILGRSELAVRLPALLLGAATVWALFRITERLVEDGRVALWVALLACCAPLLAVGSIIHTPDAALAAAWAWALCFALAAMRRDRWRDWVGLGLMLGLAVLAKASGWMLVAGLGLFALSSQIGRERMTGAGPILAAGLLLLVAGPNLWWELAHDGQSLGFQVRHAFGQSALRPLGLFDFVGAQLGVVSPLLLLACAIFWARAWRREVRFGRPEAYLLWCASGPWMAGFVLLSLLKHVEANWPGPLYLAALPGMAWALLGGALYLRRRRLWTGLALGLALGLSLIIHLQAVCPFLPLSAKADPTARLRGWQALADKAVADADVLGACLAAEGYGPASELAFYSGRAVSYEPSSARLSQYDLNLTVTSRQERKCPSWLVLQPSSSQHPPRHCEESDDRWLLTSEDPRFRWWVCASQQETRL